MLRFYRSFAVLSQSHSTTGYSRKVSDQVAAAPAIKKQVSKLANGVTIATVDEHGPASSLSIVLAAGSRFNSGETPGLSHVLQKSLVRVRA